MTCYARGPQLDSNCSLNHARFALWILQTGSIQPEAPLNSVHWLIFRGYHDSWKAIFLKDCVDFLWSLNMLYWISLPNIAASQGHECGQRLLPVCMRPRGSIGVAAGCQTLKDLPILPPPNRKHRKKACLLPRQLDLSVWTVPDNWQCAIHVSTSLGGSTLRGTCCTLIWPKQPSANQPSVRLSIKRLSANDFSLHFHAWCYQNGKRTWGRLQLRKKVRMVAEPVIPIA